MHLISVDLPAPLSPSSASTSPWSHLEVDAVERQHGAEPLGRRARAMRRGRSCQRRLEHPEPLLERGRGSRRSRRPATMTTPMTIGWRNASTLSRFIPLRITPIISAPTRALATVPRPPRKLAPPMITAAIESSSARLPAVGEPALRRPEVMIAATPASRPHST